MVHDIETSIDWVLHNVEEFGGDASKVVLVGQSAGAHLGGVCVVRKVLDRIRRLRLNKDSLSTADEDAASAADGHDAPFKTSYEATDLCGFISTSSPHNLVTMKQVFHRHGLSCSVQRSIFGGSELDGTDASGQDVFEKWSTFHLAKRCHDEYASLVEGRETEVLNAGVELSLKDLFPNLCIIHGTNDKTVSSHPKHS
jgi:prenylcysteine alpha-carboxyl methylesterase